MELDAESIVATAWRDGVGPEDATMFAGLPPDGTPLALFASLATLARGERAVVPPEPAGAPERVLFATIEVRNGVLAREPRAIDAGVARLADALTELRDDDPHASGARAWADLALGEVALLVGDRRVAYHRFEAIALPQAAPIALRIEAMRQLVGLAVERGDLVTAHGWARKAVRLAETGERATQTTQARLAMVLLDYAIGDVAAIREAIAALGEVEPAMEIVARLLLAAMTPDDRSDMVSARTLLEETDRHGDPLLYALVIVVLVRRAIAHGDLEGVTWLLTTGVARLSVIAPHLVPVLDEILHG